MVECRSDNKIEWLERFGLQLTRAFDEVGDGDAFGDFDNGFAHFFHEGANGATGFVRTRTFFVEVLADATDGGERAFDVANNGGERNFFGWPGQAVAADDSAAALDDAGGFEIVENLLKKALGNVLRVGDCLDSHDAVVILESENQQSAERVFAAKRQLHGHLMYNVHQICQALRLLFVELAKTSILMPITICQNLY